MKPSTKYPEFTEDDLPIQISDLTKLRVSDHSGNVWVHSKRLSSEVELVSNDKIDSSIVDFLNLAIDDFFESQGKLLNIVFEDYREYAELQPEELDEYTQVGSKAAKDEIHRFLESQTIYVTRKATDIHSVGYSSSRWYARSEWDDDHSICIDLETLRRVDY